MNQKFESNHSTALTVLKIRCLRLHLRILTLGLFVLASLSQLQPVMAQANNPLVGDWLGSLSTQAGDLRVVFHVREAGDALQLTMDSPDQNAAGIPATVTSAATDALRFDVTVASGYFEGVLAPDNSTLIGTWHQAGGSMPLQLARQEGMAEIDVQETSSLESELIAQLEGSWNGTVNAPGMVIPIKYSVVRLSASEAEGRFGVSTQGITDFPFQIAADSGEITFSVTSLRATFRGRFNDEENELAGNFSQNGQQFPLNLVLSR